MCRELIFPACLILALGVANVTSAATDPYPADGAMQPQTGVILTWTPGAGALSYDVYIGDNLDEVEAGTSNTSWGNQMETFFLVGFSGFPYPGGLVRGTTYYWRIDEIWADGTIYKGTVWNFTVAPNQGWIPFIPGAEPDAVHDVKLKASDNTGIAVDSDIPGMHSVNVTVGEEVYQKLNIPYAARTAEVGKPQVPVIRRYLEIPYDANYLTVEILYSDPAILAGYNVYPAQPDMEKPESPKLVIDKKTYATDAFYPSDIAVTGEPVIMRGHKIISVILCPVRHNPVSRQLQVYSKIEVRVNYEHPAQIEGIEERLESEAFESLCEAFILNYKHPDEYLTRRYKDVGSPSVDYLIIAHDDFDTQVEPLADWKEKKGLRTEIVVTNT
ncbi:MAG: C25 family peptidase propeptide domain-containing protein, partial [Phycisphaerales bacterium]